MKVIRDLFRVFPVLFHWSRQVNGSRLTVALIIASGIFAGLGNTALIGVINAILLGVPGSRMRLLAMFIGLCVFIPASAYISQILLVRLTARAAYDIRRRL